MKFKIFFIWCCARIFFVLAVEKEENSTEFEENNYLNDILNEALQSPGGLEIANQLYNNKYSEKLVSIGDSAEYVVTDNVIHLNHAQADNFLKAFGSSIKNLKIEYGKIPADEHANIGKIVNDYCSKTLFDFRIDSCKNDAFDKIKQPFKAVELLSFKCELTDASKNSLTIDKLFPKLRILELQCTGAYFNHKFEHLEELKVNQLANDLSAILKRNLQIRKLELIETSLDDMRIASETLPRLNSLILFIWTSAKPYKGPTIQFENVKYIFAAGQNLGINPKQIQFKHVEDFSLNLIGQSSEWLVEFLEDVEGIKTLHITTTKFNNSTLSQLCDKHVSLRLAILQIDSSVDFECINKLLYGGIGIHSLALHCDECELLFKKLHENLNREQWGISLPDPSHSQITIMNVQKFNESEFTNSTAETSTVETPWTCTGAASIYASTALIITILVLILSIYFD